MIENVEADDVISYVVQMDDFEDWQKVIYSSDKDFYQLTRGSVGDIDTLLYRIHPRNFAVARAIAGDKSDNLPGAPNVGLGKIAKRFPYLAEEKEHSLQEIFEDCEKNLGKLKIYDSIIDNRNKILTNYGMMQLDAPNIPYQSTKIIKDSIREMDMSFDKTSFEVMKRQDDIATARHDDLCRHMKRFSAEAKNSD
jgi:5'-3' exonuclease